MHTIQARKASIEAELGATKAELQELRFREQQLESRNVLLERVAEINNADTDTLSAQASIIDDQFMCCNIDCGRMLTATTLSSLCVHCRDWFVQA